MTTITESNVTHIEPVSAGHYIVLEQRAEWLLSKIDAGKAMGIKTDRDQELYDALTWALERLDK